MPEWERINKDPEFIAWLGLTDDDAGKSKLNLIKEAYESFDAEKVASFFLQFINKKSKQIPDVQPRTGPYKKGDFIGQKYEVYDVLGEGGFGIVYLVYSHATKNPYALKTFRDEYLADINTRERFKKEAQVWIDLERHPYLVRAYFVEEISGRLFIAMKHIASEEPGMNTLSGYLKNRPPDLAQTLRWAIQFCYGMEHAYSKGIKAHRDIKPSNIMIDQNKTVKIADFGLAGVLLPSSISEQERAAGKSYNDSSMQTAIGTSIGTPEYMSPEQFTDLSSCDERSDLYSFGIVLYQMASGGKLPFSADNPDYRWAAFKHFHQETLIPKLSSPLFPIIQGCLEKEPNRRFQTFKELRTNLELLLKKQTGEVVKFPELKELETWELINKGICYGMLGKNDEAIKCFKMAKSIETGKDGKNAIGECHYQFAYVCLKKLFFDKPQWLTSMLASNEKRAFLVYLWEKTAELLGEEKISSEGLSCGSIKIKGDITITVVQFPKPLNVGEAYYAALVYRPPKGFLFKQENITRYITLERSFIENNYLCEWIGQERGHINIKGIHSITPENFIEEVQDLIGNEPSA